MTVPSRAFAARRKTTLAQCLKNGLLKAERYNARYGNNSSKICRADQGKWSLSGIYAKVTLSEMGSKLADRQCAHFGHSTLGAFTRSGHIISATGRSIGPEVSYARACAWLPDQRLENCFYVELSGLWPQHPWAPRVSNFALAPGNAELVRRSVTCGISFNQSALPRQRCQTSVRLPQ